MPSQLLHATCVAVGEAGVLLRGPSGAGKSDLALRLIDGGARLVADDQAELRAEGGRLLARAPEVLAGKLEVRGLGILDLDHRNEVSVCLLVDLTPGRDPERLPEPEREQVLGIWLPVMALDPCAPSASAKLRLAAVGAAALQQPGAGLEIAKTVTTTTDSQADAAVPEGQGSNRLILVTGMSGAGRSSVLKALEDRGYEAIDNLPLGFLAAVTRDRDLQRPLAVGIDTRTRSFAVEAFIEAADGLAQDRGPNPTLVFIDCDDEVLARRFTETRRRHPLAQDRPAADGIKLERRLVTPLRARADLVIDTSELTPGALRALLVDRLQLGDAPGMVITVTSFSYRYGLPREADLVFDVRFLANPYYEPELRPLTGRDAKVAAYVESDSGFSLFFNNLTEMLEPLLPRYEKEGKSYLTLAVGCTGGRHRSVATAERLAAWLRDKAPQVRLSHRDLERGSAGGAIPKKEGS